MLKKFLVTFAFLILLFSTNVFASNSATPLYDEDLVTTINTNLAQALASRDLDINDYHYIIYSLKGQIILHIKNWGIFTSIFTWFYYVIGLSTKKWDNYVSFFNYLSFFSSTTILSWPS